MIKHTEKELLADTKQALFKKPENFPKDNKDSLQLMFRFFTSNVKDLEQKSHNQELYEMLGWQDEMYFDVISSFWTVFACAVIMEVHDNKAYSRTAKYCCFPDYKTYFTPWIPGGKYGYINKATGKREASFPQRYLEPREGIVRIVHSTVQSYPQLNELAALTHCVANFMPCPPPEYNHEKGLAEKVHDFLPLFVDFIDAHCESGSDETADMQKWKAWLIANRERFCLEDYYTVQNNHIKGIPFFRTQSLNHPLPSTKSEITECLAEMTLRIRTRANRLLELHKMEG